MQVKELRYNEGAQYITAQLQRLTLLRPVLNEEPMQSLIGLLDALKRNDAALSISFYHELSYALFEGDYRRISGDLFHDYLIYCLLEKTNPFSTKAAASNRDEPLCQAMRKDLTVMNALFSLNSALIKDWIAACPNNPKKTQKEDNIAKMSSAVWSGGALRPLPSINENPQKPDTQAELSLNRQSYISWRYQAVQGDGGYVSDQAYLELVRRLLGTEDRALLLDDFLSFHKSYGNGIFIRDRLFMLTRKGSLSPIRNSSHREAYPLYENEREQQMKNAVRFMQGEHADNMLITGSPGTGKSMQVFSLAVELPELRLIICPPGLMRDLIDVLPVIIHQPYKFLILLEDFNAQDPQWPELKLHLSPGSIRHENILIAACAKEADDAFFPLRIRLNAPQLKEFIELVQLILWQRGVDTDYESIQNACIDYAASANGLSLCAAGLIAQSLEPKVT